MNLLKPALTIAFIISATTMRLFYASEAYAGGNATFARNISLLVYAEKRCPSLRVNHTKLEKSLRDVGLDTVKLLTENKSELENNMSILEEKFGNINQETFCNQMEDQFGPGGTSADGLLKRR